MMKGYLDKAHTARKSFSEVRASLHRAEAARTEAARLFAEAEEAASRELAAGRGFPEDELEAAHEKLEAAERQLGLAHRAVDLAREGKRQAEEASVQDAARALWPRFQEKARSFFDAIDRATAAKEALDAVVAEASAAGVRFPEFGPWGHFNVEAWRRTAAGEVPWSPSTVRPPRDSVRILRRLETLRANPGEMIQLPPDEAARLVELGYVERVEEAA